MKRLQLGLTDIERRMLGQQRRLRNVVKVLVLVALVGGFINYITR